MRVGDLRNEPSMEDILSSIKRIIAEDGAAALTAVRDQSAARADAEPAAEVADDTVLELTEPAPPSLVSSDVANASRESLAALSAMVIRPDTGGTVAHANTLEALVREMLRPMLKEWLDAKLPELVEGLVAREIARITGKAL